MIIAMRRTVDGREYVRLPGGRYVRPIAGGKGGGSSTTTTVPPKSEEELSVLRKQNELLELQIQEVQRQNEALAEVFPQQKELLKAQTDVALSQVKLFQEASGMLGETPTQKKIREASEERSLAILEGRAPQLAPDQERHIDELIAAEREGGQREISRFLSEEAGARGLKVTDSPIAREAARAAGELETGLRSTSARAKLDFGQANQAFAESTRQFQEALRQRSFQNRLAMLGSPASSLPLFGTTNPTAALAGTTNVLDSLARDRLAATSTTSRTKESTTQSISPYLQAGATVAAAAILASTARVKKHIVPLDEAEFGASAKRKRIALPIGDEYDRVLKTLTDTPIARWRYVWDRDDRHARTGPILELSPEEIKEDDAHIDPVSYMGMLHAGLKAVDRKVTRLAHDAGQTRRALPLEID